MKYDNIRAFQKHLVSAGPSHFSSAYLLLSQEEFLLKEALKSLTEALGKAEVAVASESVYSEIASMNLFQKRKLVIAEEADKIPKKEQELLIEWVKKPARECYLVLRSAALKKTSSLYKAIEKYGIIFETPEVKPWQKEKEALAWVREMGKIDERAAMLLVEFTGSDKMALFSELEKLSIYAADKGMIHVADVIALCRATPKENLFKLAESLLLRDGKKAVKQILALQQEGVQPMAMLRLLRQQFETDLQVAILCKQGLEEEVSNLFPYMKGFILQQHKKQALAYGIPSFKKGLLAIDKAENRLKSLSVDQDILMSTLIAELCIL